MFEVVWQEINKSDRLVTKRKEFKTESAMQKKDSFYGILATR